MAKRTITKLRNGHIAVESDHPKARHLYQIAEELGCTMADLVGPERAEFYARNAQEVEIIEAMRRVPEAEQEALSLMVHAASIGELSTEDMLAMSGAKNPNAALLAWRDSLSAEQAARYRSAS